MSKFTVGHNDNLLKELNKHGTHHTTTHSKLDIVASNTEPIKSNGKVVIGSATAMAMYPDETAPMMDDNARSGWYFDKQMAGSGKINWYFYGDGNTFTTLGDLKSISCIISIDAYTATSSLPFWKVYTKATGSGDYSWYKSAVTYTLSAGEKIMIGEKIQAWCGEKPKQHSNLRMVEFNTVSTLGTADAGEELLTMAINTDSASAVGTKLLVSQLGFDLYDEKLERRIDLDSF